MRILRGLRGQPLPCGCLIGIYETYEGPVVHVIDAVSHGCPNPRHRLGERMLPGDEYGPPAPLQRQHHRLDP